MFFTDPQERLALVQKVAEEHQQYQSRIHEFQKWLVSKTDEVSRFTETEDVSENRLRALQVLSLTSDVVRGKKKGSLQRKASHADGEYGSVLFITVKLNQNLYESLMN